MKPRAKKTQTAKTHCLKEARAFTQHFPETTETALFAYSPEALSEQQKLQLDQLYEGNANYKRIVDRMRKDRKWLAPQFGLQ